MARTLGILIAVVVAVTAAASAVETRTIKNPVAPDGHDPWVVRHDGQYYYCYSARGRIWVNRAARIEDAVQFTGQAVWRPEPGRSYSKELWAPELHRLDGRWFIYVAADDGRNENHRMYVLTAETDDPTGPFTFRGKIADATDKWAIDATVLEHKGTLYFIWSGWEGDVNVRQDLYIARMSDPLTIVGPRVLISKPEHDWETIGEPLVNEGPQVLKHDDDVFIIYSASGSWTDDYCLGQLKLVGDDPMDPKAWVKKATAVFSSTATVFAPGHASFTKSPDGSEDWIVYHTAKRRGAGWDRHTRMQRFTWDAEGHPCFGVPVSDKVEIAAPSE